MLALIGQVDGKKLRTYVSVKDACKLSGYKEQYLRQLLRQKKLTRKKFGHGWPIDVSSLENYLLSSKQSKDRRYGPRTQRCEKWNSDV
jgi:hypothetical protein